MSLTLSSRPGANVLSLGSDFAGFSVSTVLSPVSITFSRAIWVATSFAFPPRADDPCDPLLSRAEAGPAEDPFPLEEDPLPLDNDPLLEEALSDVEELPA